MADAENIVKVRRRQDRSIQTRLAILESAKVEFASNGFGGATTRAIAERACVRHGMLVYHFENKLGVWQAMMEQFLKTWSERLLAAVRALIMIDEVAALRAFQRTFVEMSAADPDAHWLMSDMSRDASDRVSSLIDRLIGRDIEVFVDLIRRVQAKGQLIEGDPSHLYYAFIGASSRIFMVPTEVARVTGQSPFSHAFVEEHIRICERMFFRNLAS